MKKILKPFKVLICLPVYAYKFCISPFLPHVCRFIPSCSNYFVSAVDEFGIFKGTCLGVKRFLRCTPHSKSSGFDPVPLNPKGETKWLL